MASIVALINRAVSAPVGKLNEATKPKVIKNDKDQKGGEAFAKDLVSKFDGTISSNGPIHKVYLDYAKWKASEVFPNEKLRNAATEANALVLAAHEEVGQGKLVVYVTDANAFQAK